MIEITSDTIERVETLLAGVPKGAERAFSNAMNRGVTHLKSQSFKEVRKVYAVKQGDLQAATKTRVRKATTGNLVGEVNFSSVKIPLYKFNVSPKNPGTGKVVQAGQLIGSKTPFEDAFIAKMGSGHVGIFERTGEQGIKARLAKAKSKSGNKHTEKIEEKMGLSASQMIENEHIIDGLIDEAQQTVDERLKHEIDRILNGYGG